MRQFKYLPILPHVGSSLVNYIKILRGGKIEPRYYFKVFLTGVVILIVSLFHIFDFIWFRRKIKKLKFTKGPLFIIGHWRSGTTLVHNYLCHDKRFGYLHTYQSLFPNNINSAWLFKTFARLAMPSKRPSDNMDLTVDLPQEDELALGNIHSNFYYNFFYLPTKYNDYYDKAVRMKVIPSKKEAWKKSYTSLLKKALLVTGGERVVMKNPVNTARVKLILEIFPDAKFLFLYRNPVTIYNSSVRFFSKLLPTVWLHKVDKRFIDTMVLDIFKRLLEDYYNQKHLIPEGNLMELKFEEFEKDPIGLLQMIYEKLLQEDFGPVGQTFIQYRDTLSKYEKNSYPDEKREHKDMTNKHLKEYLKKWNYQ